MHVPCQFRIIVGIFLRRFTLNPLKSLHWCNEQERCRAKAAHAQIPCSPAAATTETASPEAVGHFHFPGSKAKVEILLDQHDRHLALIPQQRDHPADLLDDVGLDALGRLIEQKQFGPGDQRARDGQLLLLAARQVAAAPVLACP
jgi:hypothetical protein